MEFIEEPYIGKSITDLETIFYSLKRRIPVMNIYCICISEESQFLLEIMSSKELYHQRNQNKKYCIAGIAQGKKEAYDLVRYMVENCCHGEDNEKDWKQKLKQ